MKRIQLKGQILAKIDDCDFNLVNEFKWYFETGGYAINREGKRMHSLIIDLPKGMEIDHINRNKLDNRRSNLRICEHKNNLKNCKLRKDSTSGYKGVVLYKNINKWRARIDVDGKNISLGYFHEKDDAAKAYNEAAIKYHGPFAHINYVGQMG